MSKSAGGSLPRVRRLRHEVPPVPESSQLTPLHAEAQRALAHMVEQAGGRFDSRTSIPIDRLDTLTRLFDEWGRRYAVAGAHGLYFSGRPGLWHALDELMRLQDPNRWDGLRKAIILELERQGWRRRSHPRGAGFDLPS